MSAATEAAAAAVSTMADKASMAIERRDDLLTQFVAIIEPLTIKRDEMADYEAVRLTELIGEARELLS